MDPMTTSNLLKNANKALEPFLKKIGSELGELASDQLRYMRWKAATKILKRAKYFCESNHIPLKQIPLKFLLPFIEGASLEDVEKPSLVDMWASLLISRLNKEDARAFLFINILKSLSSAEAKEVSKLAKRIVKKKDNLLISDDLLPDMPSFIS